MPRKTNHTRSGKSDAVKLKERLASEKGKRFKQLNFHPLDPESRVLERSFHETGETVRVHLTPRKRIQAVYLLHGS
jgi:hypothetical protein